MKSLKLPSILYCGFLLRSNALSPNPQWNRSQSSQTEIATKRRSMLKIVLGASAFLTKASDAQVSISSDDLRRIYDEGAATYESLYSESIVSRTLDFPTLRSNLLSKAYGDVLELGVGTGLNLPQYPSESGNISTFTALDLSPKMMKQAQEKFSRGFPNVASSLDALYKQNLVTFQVGDVGKLESQFNGKKFDTIVDTFGLCVFPEPVLALKQAKAVLKPGGKVILLEHQDSLIGKALNPTRNIADVISTCRYDDNVPELLKSAGFKEITLKSYAGGFLVEVVARA